MRNFRLFEVWFIHIVLLYLISFVPLTRFPIETIITRIFGINFQLSKVVATPVICNTCRTVVFSVDRGYKSRLGTLYYSIMNLKQNCSMLCKKKQKNVSAPREVFIAWVQNKDRQGAFSFQFPRCIDFTLLLFSSFIGTLDRPVSDWKMIHY